MKLQLSGRRYLHLTSLNAVADELKQKQAITDSLINKILYSKRLLVDHVEALEQCMRHLGAVVVDTVDAGGKPKACPSADTEIFTAKNACLLIGTTLLEHIFTPKVLRLTLLPSLVLSGGFSAMYVVKNVFVFRNKIVERELDKLIQTIDEFGNCIRRNMTYFNEIIIMKQHELIESRQIERAWDCITAAKEVTEILYDATRKLETQYAIPARFTQYYSPMEELRDCEYFKNNVTDYSPKHIKDFHNIFAYVQSQFLLRLALSVATRPSISQLNVDLVKLDCLIRQLVLEEENHFKNLALELGKRKQMELDELIVARTQQNRSGPVAVLQDSSLKLSACMVAVAGECQALDITLQRLNETEAVKRDNGKQLVEVANNMRSIESALSVCFDDFQRLMLVYNKFLSSKMDDDAENGAGQRSNKDAEDGEFPESILRVEISQHQNHDDPKDDFYAYMYDAQEARTAAQQELLDEQQLGRDLEILNFEKRVTKGKFRPVLKQLKNRIDPIRAVMLQKEREVLAAKGIDVDELFGKTETPPPSPLPTSKDNRRRVHFAKPATSDNEDDATADDDSLASEESDGSADLEYERRSKQLKERDNFAEMRNFLAQKQAINLFKLDAPLPPPATDPRSEEILESEC